MEYDRLAQSIPPAYTRLLTGQACMSVASARFGVPAISYDDHLADPGGTSRLLAGWLRGAGDDSAEAGLRFVSDRECEPCQEDGNPTEGSAATGQSEANFGSNGDDMVPGPEEDAFRELYFSHVGGFDRRLTPGNAEHWLDRLRNNAALGMDASPADFMGGNVFVRVSWHQTGKVAASLKEAVELGGRGTRATDGRTKP